MGKTRFKARKEFFGSVLRQLEEAYEYISLQNNVRADFVGLERVESCQDGAQPDFLPEAASFVTVLPNRHMSNEAAAEQERVVLEEP